MFCAEKTRLLAEYSDATAAFSIAVQELRMKIETSSREEHQRLERVTLEARMKSEQAKLALEEHVAGETAKLESRRLLHWTDHSKNEKNHQVFGARRARADLEWSTSIVQITRSSGCVGFSVCQHGSAQKLQNVT